MKKFRTHNQPQQSSLRRELRTHGTSAEAAMWSLVKARQLDGFKFRRQFSVGPYVLDFYCPGARLCLELDGQPHFTLSGDTHDMERDAYLLREHGIRTLRFENRDVFQNTEGVLEVIRAALQESVGGVVEKNCPPKIGGRAKRRGSADSVSSVSVGVFTDPSAFGTSPNLGEEFGGTDCPSKFCEEFGETGCPSKVCEELVDSSPSDCPPKLGGRAKRRGSVNPPTKE